ISFANGQTVEILGRSFSIEASETMSEGSRARLKGDKVLITMPAGMGERERRQQVSYLSRRVLTRALLPDVESRVRELNNMHFKSQINAVRLKDTATLWASCSISNNINLDFRLLFAPEHIRDAIIIHELAHTIHRNHSKAFWGLVTAAVPDYKERRKWLRENARDLKPKLVPMSGPQQAGINTLAGISNP
ncbi:MAG: M48 family metallopeptidase, partial [Candidatus Micrarchaeota archaeon]|nr:M48 family metallopeptidase [Candidatus Micrarchaeota archaeon]